MYSRKLTGERGKEFELQFHRGHHIKTAAVELADDTF